MFVLEDHGHLRPEISRKLGVKPNRTVVLEDSLAGVAAALAAGMRVIAVPPPHLYDEPGYDEVDLKLRSLEGLTAADLEGLCAPRS